MTAVNDKCLMNEELVQLFSDRTRFSEEEVSEVSRAYAIARDALKDLTRGNNTPFINHPIGTVKIICGEMSLPADCAVALLLHEATRFRPELMSGAEYASFPADIRGIVDGLNKIAQIRPKDTRLEADNYRRMIISYSRDPRVTLIKIADRLEVMRNLRLLPKASRERKVLESLLLYVPIAHQLGLYKVKGELEDMYLRYTNPEMYYTITNKLKVTAPDRERIAEHFIEPLKDSLSQAGISYKLKVRTKTAYSIWMKMMRQKVPFEKVFDVFAIRFIIDCDGTRKEEVDLCWDVFSKVTEKYSYNESRVRDWITVPKKNGYESLHVTVEFAENSALEVQIRTRRMDDFAENGGASHWAYKGIKGEGPLDTWLANVRAALESNEKISYGKLPESMSGEVFVFTPTGELRQLPAGATLLDFAFCIHTNLGLKCSGGRINSRIASIRDVLSTGDVVEIMTNRNQKPNVGWLDFTVTSKARNKIRQKLAEEEFKKAAEGKELLFRRLKNWKLEITDGDIACLIKKYQLKTVNAFYCAVAEQKIDVHEIKSYLSCGCRQDREACRPGKQEQLPSAGRQSSDDFLVIGGNIKNISYRLAKCCSPVYGDDVFGFVSSKGTVTVHRMSCPNASRMADKYNYRIHKVRWSDTAKSPSAQVTVRVLCSSGDDRLITEMMEAVSSYKASVRSMSVNERRSGDVTREVQLTISVCSNLELDKVMAALRKIKGVTNVLR